jgi:serine/threonine protein kinase
MGDMPPGSVFAGHRIEAVAGRGGMGVVYRARQLSLDRIVALKVIAPALMADEAIRHRFLRESRVAASIDHPHVLPIYYAGEDAGVAYIAMRHVAGDDLRTLVRRNGPLEPARAARIVEQVAAALDAAHASGLVHRDVKPANVLLGQGEHAYLTDFGLTKHVLSEGGATKPGHWVGTLDFIAPEQIRGERVDARADVYALAARRSRPRGRRRRCGPT